MVEDFYEELYGEKDINNDILKEVLELINKTVKESTYLTKDFNLIEMEKCLKHLKERKSPGEDGLPLEFYKTFWDILAHDLLAVLINFMTWINYQIVLGLGQLHFYIRKTIGLT